MATPRSRVLLDLLLPSVRRLPSLSSSAPSLTAARQFSSAASDFLVSRARASVASEFAKAAAATPTAVSSDLIDQPISSHPDINEATLLLESRESLDVSAFPEIDSVDPFSIIQGDMRGLVDNIKGLVGVDHPVLSTVASYFFNNEGGKKIRPAMVLLMAYATNAGHTPPMILPSQARLAEITEMIHTASLLHDDVIDMADTRRGVGSVNTVFGNKLAVLAGDFLLARSSLSLARLRNVEVVELLSTVIEHLVRGEVMQVKHVLQGSPSHAEVFELYLKKTYYKTGSLMANSCKAVSLIADQDAASNNAAFLYGRHVGIAFQLVDDMLDFEGTANSLGKPCLNDLKQGMATAPVLFASRDNPILLKLIERKFEGKDDVAIACDCVQKFDGIDRTRKLAYAHGQMALDALATLPPSAHRTALAALVTRVVNRVF